MYSLFLNVFVCLYLELMLAELSFSSIEFTTIANMSHFASFFLEDYLKLKKTLLEKCLGFSQNIHPCDNCTPLKTVVYLRPNCTLKVQYKMIRNY